MPASVCTCGVTYTMPSIVKDFFRLGCTVDNEFAVVHFMDGRIRSHNVLECSHW